MPECDTRGCLGYDVEAVLVVIDKDIQHRLLCGNCRDFWREAGWTVVTEHKVKVWLAHTRREDGIRLDPGNRDGTPWKWLFECTCGAGGMSWSWDRAYDMANSGLPPEQWIEENGQPTGGALNMALDHLGLGPQAKQAIDSIKEALA